MSYLRFTRRREAFSLPTAVYGGACGACASVAQWPEAGKIRVLTRDPVKDPRVFSKWANCPIDPSASGLLPGYCTYVFVRFSSPYGHREMCPPELNLVYMSLSWVKTEESAGSESFVIGNEYLDKLEDNASVCTWSRKTQLEKGDSVTEGYTSELWDFTRINSTQNKFQELRDIWAQWDDETKQLFYQNYGDLPYLLDVKVDRRLFRTMVQFWNPAYSCFTFGDVDLVPTLEEYTTLLRCPRIQGYKAYVRPASFSTFTKKLVMITGMSKQWVVARVQQKGDNTHVPAILAEMFRSLSACRRAGERRFIGYAQLLLVWFHSHFWKVDKVPCRVFFKDYSPLKEAVDMPRRDDISEERWIDILHNLREEDVMWKALWLVPSEVLYRYGSFDWVSLPGIWGVVGYAPLLVLRQYRARQFIPATQGLAQSDFSYKGDHYKKRMREISEAWKKPFCMNILTEGLTPTVEYKGWFSRKVNNNVPRPILGVARSLEESLRVIPSELEVMK
ncbi:hypothetical protein CXB51_016674 [Gossypium anomalum]|uniref:DUF7745 domain-containing protein n=1 Tax=Gossypium anomalum TaxID=47600 RepID=A0A8J6CY07_9ROSI|nr:hypothetical protein CXB51_016674 [Gossypium anomalum]